LSKVVFRLGPTPPASRRGTPAWCCRGGTPAPTSTWGFRLFLKAVVKAVTPKVVTGLPVKGIVTDVVTQPAGYHSLDNFAIFVAEDETG
jgi:hypothetical protein